MIYLDFETRSELNIGKAKAGRPSRSTYDYACHESTEILSLCWAVDNGPVSSITFFDASNWPLGRMHQRKCPFYIDGKQIFIAHNAGFDRVVWDEICVKRLGWPAIPLEQWRCSMSMAGYSGFPLGLKDAAKAAGVTAKTETDVVGKLSAPRPKWIRTGEGPKWFGTPEQYAELIEYNKQDVDTMRKLVGKCVPWPEFERRVWQVDQEINARGVRIHRPLAETCDALLADMKKKNCAELETLTNDAIKTPGQRDKILALLKDEYDLELPDLTKETVRDVLVHMQSGPAKRILEIRQETGGNAGSKFLKMQSLASPHDDRVRGGYVYYGAWRTGRWTSWGLQLHNMVKQKINYAVIENLIPALLNHDTEVLELFGEFKDVLDSYVRTCFIPAPGHVFVAQDFSAIEARTVGWLANDEKLLDQFRSGIDLYKVMAAKIFGVSVNAVTPTQRALGKQTVLGCGFGMGSDTFYARCLMYGIEITPDLADRAVKAYREEYYRVVRFWYALERAFRDACQSPGVKFGAGRVSCIYSKKQDVLAMILPSGRALYYRKPRVDVGGDLSYLGRLGQDEQGAIGRVRTWGSRLAENATQATARDFQAVSLVRAHDAGLRVALHSHDELCAEVLEADADTALEQLAELMTRLSAWAAGLPLKVEGWIGNHFRKD